MGFPKRLLPNAGGGGAYPAFQYTPPAGYVAPNAGNTVPITNTVYDPGVTYNGVDATYGDLITFPGSPTNSAWVAGPPMYRQANFYWEVRQSNSSALFFGISRGTNDIFTSIKVWGIYTANGFKYNAGSSSSYTGNTTTQVISVLYNTSGDLSFYLNGSNQGVAYSGIGTYAYYPWVSTIATDSREFYINLVGA